MGDFFDDFRTGVTDAADTANQVKRWLNDPNTTCFLGNHDMSYGWCRQNRQLVCPGYDAAKWIAINAIVTTRDWQQFKLHAWLEGDRGAWLVSHAGVHTVWLEGAEPGKYREFITRACADAWTCLDRGEHHFLLGRGVSRSGDQRIGGINWMDWDELVPVPVFEPTRGAHPGQIGAPQEHADEPEHLPRYQPPQLRGARRWQVGDQELRRPVGRNQSQIESHPLASPIVIIPTTSPLRHGEDHNLTVKHRRAATESGVGAESGSSWQEKGSS